MSFEQSSSRLELLRAIEDWHEGVMDSANAERFKDRLRNDLGARQVFIEYGDMLASLEFGHSIRQAELDDAISIDAIHARERRQQSTHAWLAFGVATIAVCCLLAGAVFFVRPAVLNHLPGVNLLTPVAKIIEIRNLGDAWQSSQSEVSNNRDMTPEVIRSGQQFLPGDRLVFSNQNVLVRLEFDSGAQLSVKGPSELRFVEGNAVRLIQGTALGVVPAPAQGFTVYLPQGQVRDLGTEFAIAIDGEESHVSVLKGSVECFLTAQSDPLSRMPLLLRTGENARLDPTRTSPIVVEESHELMESIVGVHSGVLKTSGDVHFTPVAPPLAMRNKKISLGKILVYQEKCGVPIRWKPDSFEFIFVRGEQQVEPEHWHSRVHPDDLPEMLQNVTEEATFEIDSYLVNMAAVGKTAIVLEGSIQFGGEILAVMRSNISLASTDWISPDPEFAHSWAQNNVRARGSAEGDDKVQIEADGKSMTMTLKASGAGDQLRVFVRSSQLKKIHESPFPVK